MIDTILNAQAGAISTGQLLACGLSRGQIARRAKNWLQPRNGIYVTDNPSWEASLWAGTLAGGQHAAIGETAAAKQWGFLDETPQRITVWSPMPRQSFLCGDFRIDFRRGSRRSRRRPALTLVEETILDVANTASETEAIAVLLKAFSERLTVGARVLSAMSERVRQRHRRVLEELCAGQGTESVLEYLFLRNAIDAHGLPRPKLQAWRRAGRVDAHYEQFGLIVELDGHRFHKDRHRDHFRDNEHLLAHSELTLRFGWSQANDGACVAAEQLLRALRARGWSGNLLKARCPCLHAFQ